MDYNIVSDEDIIRDLAEKYEKIRIEKRLKDTEVAEKAGISRQLLSDFRNGKRSISLKSFIRLLRGIDELDSFQKNLKSSEELSIFSGPDNGQPKRIRDRQNKPGAFKWGDET